MNDITLFKNVNELSDEINRYYGCMAEIRYRWRSIYDTLRKPKNEQMPIHFFTEAICVQFRSIMELIILANFSTHQKHYDATVKLTWWNIKDDITPAIVKVNKDFYPTPIKISKKPVYGKPGYAGTIRFSKKSHLPLETLYIIYNKCGNYLHPNSPFKPMKDYNAIARFFQSWLQKIKGLLESHSIKLAYSENVLAAKMDFLGNVGAPDIEIYYISRHEDLPQENNAI